MCNLNMGSNRGYRPEPFSISNMLPAKFTFHLLTMVIYKKKAFLHMISMVSNSIPESFTGNRRGKSNI